MKKVVLGMAAAAFALAAWAPAQATTVNDTSLVSPPGVYFGTGNGGNNVHWTVDTQGSIELGLAAIQRGVGNNITPIGNVYNVPLGPDPSASNRAYWNFDYSVNLRATGLNNSTYTLGEFTTSLSVHDVAHNTTIAFDPFIGIGDNSAYGANGVTRNGNVSGQQATVNDVGFQNSENLTFYPWGAGLPFNMNANDTYIITLLLTNSRDISTSVSMDVVAGTGASPTPLPAALPLFATGIFGGSGLMFWRRKKKATKALSQA